jgi:hypothetical protein
MVSPLKCPICGSDYLECAVDTVNLNFLEARVKDGKLNAALSLTRIAWENIPELRLTSDSRALLEGLSEATQKNLAKQSEELLKPFESFMKKFTELSKKLPVEMKEDMRREFKETLTRIEEEFTLLRGSVPTFNNVVDALKTVSEGMESMTKKEIEDFKQDMTNKLREIIKTMNFPEPQQMKLLSELVPRTLPLLQELVRIQKVPMEKGNLGELELLKELHDYFPEDDCSRLGFSGDTDILAVPKFNGTNLGWRVVIESKKNDSGWSRSFLQEVKNHMKIRGERFGLLAVEVMPRGANGFMIEPCAEGVILVSSRESFRVTYGALRAVLIALHPFNAQPIDIKKILTDKRIADAINNALQYQEYINNIRRSTQKIVTNAKSISQSADDLDSCLKRSLEQLQQRINNTIDEMA